MWLQTYTGIKFDLTNPQPSMVNIQDIAHHLSLINRFNGATFKPYSVAQHSVEVSLIIPSLAALLHDAHEAYMGDIITPVKSLLAQACYLEDAIDRAIIDRFLCGPLDLDEIHEADLRMTITERNQLLSYPPEPWTIEAEPYNKRLSWISPEAAEDNFLNRFLDLGGKF